MIINKRNTIDVYTKNQPIKLAVANCQKIKTK